DFSTYRDTIYVLSLEHTRAYAINRIFSQKCLHWHLVSASTITAYVTPRPHLVSPATPPSRRHPRWTVGVRCPATAPEWGGPNRTEGSADRSAAWFLRRTPPAAASANDGPGSSRGLAGCVACPWQPGGAPTRRQ